jgi:hypothetical protein
MKEARLWVAEARGIVIAASKVVGGLTPDFIGAKSVMLNVKAK